MSEPDTIPWYKDPKIQAGLTLFLPALWTAFQHGLGQWVSVHTGWNVMSWTTEEVKSWLIVFIATFGGYFFIRKRIQSGKDPANPAPLIIPPKFFAAPPAEG